MKPSLSQTSPTHGSGEGVVIRGLKQRIKKLEEMVTSLDDKIRNMDGEMKENETLREQIRSLEEANKAQGQERKELEKRIKKLEGEKSQLESRISKQEDKNKQLNDNLKELDVSSLLSSERDEIAAWNVQIKENIEQFRKEFQELNMENDAMKTSFADALKGNVAVKEAVKTNFPPLALNIKVAIPILCTPSQRITVTDVNDNPPFLARPREVQILENAHPQTVAQVKLDDPDDWRQGHGPPFNIALDPRAPTHIKSSISLQFDRRGDEGRGVGIVSTTMALDREERRSLLVPLVVSDAGSPPLSTTVTFTIHVADINDNPMAPASKIITVHNLQPQITSVPLGRIYVKDPDDWDATSKTYEWKKEHPYFLLNSKTGDLSMKPDTPDGSYDLSFAVSDASQRQFGVGANVTVNVNSLSHEEVKSATPVVLGLDPYKVIREEKDEVNLLNQLVSVVKKWITPAKDVRAVSVQQIEGMTTPFTRVWLTTHSHENLYHFLLHRKQELEHAIGAQIVDVGVRACKEQYVEEPSECSFGCSTKVSLESGFSLIDANISSIVGPWVSIQNDCNCRKYNSLEMDLCTPKTCLNGGRCIPTDTGIRCICPYGTTGSRCKVLARSFKGAVGQRDSSDRRHGGGGVEGGGKGVYYPGGWAWVPSIPACSEIHISLEFLSSQEDGILLYSGPKSSFLPPSSSYASTSTTSFSNKDMFALEIQSGRPTLVLDLGAGTTILTLNSSYTLADFTWHRLDITWKNEFVEMIVDLCSGSSIDGPPPTQSLNNSTTSPPSPDEHTCRVSSKLPPGARLLNTAQPLQLGGLSQPPSPDNSWTSQFVGRPFKGCIRNLRINRELIDLGHRILSKGSSPGCPEVDCSAQGLHCGKHGRCQGSPGYLRCECQSGWSGNQCSSPTTPGSFQLNSYVKLALSFTPLAYTTTIHLRFRTWKRRGELVMLSSQHGRDKLALHLMNGRLCLELQLHPDPTALLCLSQAMLSDGSWHTLAAERYGSSIILSVDDGEGDLYNASLTLEGRQLLEVDKQEGVHVGGSPEYVGLSVFKIHNDFQEGCIDDIRISGRSVPLPPALNGTPWGQASMFKGVDGGCRAPASCTNVSCKTPFTCIDTWRSYQCGCGEGRTLSSSGTVCEDINECTWEPCLNGGSCFNKESGAGYVCACPVGYTGEHCRLPDASAASLNLSLGALLSIMVWCTFLFLLICAFLLHHHNRRSALRKGMIPEVKEQQQMVNCKEHSSPPCNHTPNPLELKLLEPPKANGQAAWNKNLNIADVDVLQIESALVSSFVDGGKQSDIGNIVTVADSIYKTGGNVSIAEAQKGKSQNGTTKGGNCAPSTGDDLRNYAYEGEGSSPGSFSSCLESCSGSAKFLDGFREVAHILESWDPTNSNSNQSSGSSRTNSVKKHSSDPMVVTTIQQDTIISNCPEGRMGNNQLSYQVPHPMCEGNLTDRLCESIPTTVIPLPIPEPPCAFKNK
ncbi:hypothetical protein SK128_019333 [Halocaridina rubra]|uniref:Uncharacterized protein n=1 Tax=Halocaridina rubra TaxID=373956 RepID=A0AAN8X2Y3_HALRR